MGQVLHGILGPVIISAQTMEMLNDVVPSAIESGEELQSLPHELNCGPTLAA